MRLDKFICRSTSLSQREAITRIESGQVFVNEVPVRSHTLQVHENNHITLDGQVLTMRPPRYIMFHKPPNTVCSHTDDTYPSIFKFIEVERAFDLHLAGRLDSDTTGLVLITDDGRWTFNIISPKSQCQKTYRVTLRDAIGGDAATTFLRGIQLQGEAKPTLPAKLEIINEKEVLLSMTEGRFHQVKRMFFAIGNKVRHLHRESIGSVTLDIGAGKWRYLTQTEVDSF